MKLSFDGGDSDSKKYKRVCGGVYGGVLAESASDCSLEYGLGFYVVRVTWVWLQSFEDVFTNKLLYK
jgi:hypothetical protein